MLNIWLLGGTSFSTHGEVLKPDLGPSGRLLACYMFRFSGKVHRRERLADLFWGGLDPEKARSALNTAIWRIRKMLESIEKEGGTRLVTIGSEVLLQPAHFIEVDTDVLLNASKRILSAGKIGVLTEVDEEQISTAIEGYRGPFLDGDDADWILQEREHFHNLFIRGTLELMRIAARRRQHERALLYGKKILAIDPLREGVQRDVMLLLVLDGRRADAITAYRRLKVLLNSELDIDPMPETKLLYEDIVSGRIFNSLENYRETHFGSRPR